uniref:Large ribosomal subunit protein bL19c n=1 Tax=Bostrychia simpliciuscula TaxID=324754 RepID=A0A1Z1M859_9FLOR|nr:ribosomal protein L19 [Bostrychia simpliciuscula]ARW62160.1 ribosomal protein L19 [Bostrychia simpliciuscula]
MTNKTKKHLNIINDIEKSFINHKIPNVKIGDTIKIKRIIQEGNRERTQVSKGVIISKKNFGLNTTITVRKIIHNIGVERIYLINSPKIINIEITRKSKVRKSKLYYLRNKSGKESRLKQRFN